MVQTALTGPQSPDPAPDAPASTTGPGVVVMQWSADKRGLLEALARKMVRLGLDRITCVGDRLDGLDGMELAGVELEGVRVPAGLAQDELAARLSDQELDIAAARAVIILPRRGVDEPDSISRLTCAAIRRACGERPGPNVLVEIEDPEAAFEFVGLGVATVFYSGHLRAALLGQACIDLGVFQFILGLLRGHHRVRTLEIPEHLRAKHFADAAVELEADAQGRPMTVIGVVRPDAGVEPGSTSATDSVLVNPGPRFPLREALGLLALISAGEPEPAS